VTTVLIGELLPFAVAMAVSPMLIIVVVLILVSDGARAKGLAFVSGRMLGVALILAVVFAVFVAIGGHHVAHRGPPSKAASIIRMLVGVALILLAARMFRNRPKPGEEPPPSALMRRVDGLTAPRAFVMGLALSFLDPASLSLGFIAGLDLAEAGAPSVATLAIAVGFVLIATVTVTVPLAIYLVGGAAAEARLGGIKTWLTTNEKAVMMVLFLIVGVYMIGRGLRALGAA
jgi:threonine/homoserine/homoserine lactone efflux protein